MVIEIQTSPPTIYDMPPPGVADPSRTPYAARVMPSPQSLFLLGFVLQCARAELGNEAAEILALPSHSRSVTCTEGSVLSNIEAPPVFRSGLGCHLFDVSTTDWWVFVGDSDIICQHSMEACLQSLDAVIERIRRGEYVGPLTVAESRMIDLALGGFIDDLVHLDFWSLYRTTPKSWSTANHPQLSPFESQADVFGAARRLQESERDAFFDTLERRDTLEGLSMPVDWWSSAFQPAADPKPTADLPSQPLRVQWVAVSEEEHQKLREAWLRLVSYQSDVVSDG